MNSSLQTDRPKTKTLASTSISRTYRIPNQFVVVQQALPNQVHGLSSLLPPTAVTLIRHSTREYDRLNSDIYAPPSSDMGEVPNAKWPFGLSHNRHGLAGAGWARSQNT